MFQTDTWTNGDLICERLIILGAESSLDSLPIKHIFWLHLASSLNVSSTHVGSFDNHIDGTCAAYTSALR